MKIKKMSKKGIDMLCYHEGCKLKVYKDTYGIPTIGFGTTIINNKKVTMKQPDITIEQALEYINDYLEDIYQWLNKNLKWEPNQNEFDALCDFLYNTGIGNKFNSYINTKNAIINGYKELIPVCMKSIDRVLLKNRRTNECSMFIKGEWHKW
jgi:lysozyme